MLTSSSETLTAIAKYGAACFSATPGFLGAPAQVEPSMQWQLQTR